ncbi:MAG TPA: hypothetical protein VKH35_07210 [Thermoanaerobaculia bacterium]|nr:hypothetical protein [Thermoanaerobaculia bacterium]
MSAATFTVTSTADGGAGTLRQAITDAVSAGGSNTIAFNIAGAGAHQIIVSFSLPAITTQTLIDGTTQPGYAGTPLIEVTGPGFLISGTGASGSTIRGLDIDGFNDIAIQIYQSESNVIQSNFIGTDPTGTVANSGPDGIAIFGSSGSYSGNVIGGPTPALGNLIVTTNYAIDLGPEADSTIIAGNRIGTNAAGTAILGTPTLGIVIGGPNTTAGGTAGTTPGGACSGPCNLIDAAVGIDFGAPGTANYGTTTVQGNFVGTDITGTTSLVSGISGPSGILGAGAGTGSIQIGGTTAAARNLFSGFAQGFGIDFAFDQSTAPAVVIQGNFVGTDTTGMHAISNQVAVRVDRAAAIIGGTTAGSGNVISGSTQSNITMFPGNGVVVQGNIIGPAVDGVTNLGVTPEYGILMIGDSNNGIGGTAAGAANIIAFNHIGISVETGTGNSILSNSIFGSTQIPIQLSNFIQVPNDPCDADAGPNNLQNWPALTTALPSGGSVQLTGNLNSAPSTPYTVQIFSNPPGSPAQAQTLLMTTTLTTDATCNAPMNLTLPALPIGTMVTATATDPAGNTSGLGNGVAVSNPLTVTQSFAPASTMAFTNSVLTITIQNPTSTTLSSLAFSDAISPATILPAGAAATTCGGTVAFAGASNIDLSGGSVPPNGVCTVTMPLTSNTAGTYTALIPAGGVSGTNSVSTNDALTSVQFTAVSPPTASLSFNPSRIEVNGTSMLTITVSNPNAVPFSMTAGLPYPTGLVNSSSPSATGTCGGALFASPGGVGSAFVGQVPANGTCSMTVQVTAATAGAFVTTLRPGGVRLQSTVVNTQSASATLNVVPVGAIPALSPLALVLLALTLASVAWMAIRR